MEPMEQRVWERVMAQSMAKPEDRNIKALISESMELAAAYRQLTGSMSGKQKVLARKLYEGEMANLACLRGMAALSGHSTGKFGALPTEGKPAAKLLETCYHRSGRILMEYTARSAEPEFGVVFQRMAKREETHCALIAELLGQIRR